MTPAQLKAKKDVQQAHKEIQKAAARALAKLGYTLDEALNPVGSKAEASSTTPNVKRMSLFEVNRQRKLKEQAEWDRRLKTGEKDLGERPIVPEAPDIASLGNFRDHRLRD